MKTISKTIKQLAICCIAALLTKNAGAQLIAAHYNVPVTQNTPLPLMVIHTQGWNGYQSTATVYPLKIAAADTLFFNNFADRQFVQGGITAAAVTSVTKVIIAKTRLHGTGFGRYWGRYFDYYYYCNAINNGYFTVNGLTTKKNTTFTVSYSALNTLYTVSRNYNGNAYSEAIFKDNVMATGLAADLNGFTGTEYISKPLANLGGFYFFLSRVVTPPPPVARPLAVKAGLLIDQCDNTVLLRGINFGAYWQYDKNNPNICLNKIVELHKTNANAVRLPWSASTAFGRDATALDVIIGATVANHMIAVPEFHDITCGALTASTIAKAANYWTSSTVLPVLKKYQNKIILNIANEPGSDWSGNNAAIATKMVNAYTTAIQQLRTAGITCPLMIDAPDCGQNVEALLIAA